MPNVGSRSIDQSVRLHIDTTQASIARVYDAALNGKDNYEIDREVLRQVRAVAPGVNQLAWDNRNFLTRAIRFLGREVGMTQFLDCGSGLPTAENTHQIAQRIQPNARVVYVDNDPVVLAHGRALLEEDDQTRLIAADIFEPSDVLGNGMVRSHLDFSEPIGLLQVGTLHHYAGERDPGDIMQEYVDALAPGSHVVVAHFLDPEDEYSALARKMEDQFTHSPMGSGVFRPREAIERMFPGLKMIEPGITLCADWWPDGPRIKSLDEVQYCIAGGVGRKP